MNFFKLPAGRPLKNSKFTGRTFRFRFCDDRQSRRRSFAVHRRDRRSNASGLRFGHGCRDSKVTRAVFSRAHLRENALPGASLLLRLAMSRGMQYIRTAAMRVSGSTSSVHIRPASCTRSGPLSFEPLRLCRVMEERAGARCGEFMGRRFEKGALGTELFLRRLYVGSGPSILGGLDSTITYRGEFQRVLWREFLRMKKK